MKSKLYSTEMYTKNSMIKIICNHLPNSIHKSNIDRIDKVLLY